MTKMTNNMRFFLNVRGHCSDARGDLRIYVGMIQAGHRPYLCVYKYIWIDLGGHSSFQTTQTEGHQDEDGKSLKAFRAKTKSLRKHCEK